MISEPVISALGCSEALCRVGDYSTCCVWASASCLWWHEVLLLQEQVSHRLCHGNGWWISPKTKPVLCQCLYSEILPHTSFWLFEHVVKIMHAYLKIYVLTWILSLGRTPWVSQSELKPNASVFHVYSFHKHSHICSVQLLSWKVFFPCSLGDLCSKRIFYW